MGRSRHHNSRSSNYKKNKQGPLEISKSNQRWDALPETNLAFVEYYKNLQQIVSTEDEWNQLFTSFRTDLPTTFRVTGGKKNTAQMDQIIQDTYVPFLSKVQINDQIIPPPQKISWYPDGFAWEFRAPKQLIRKSPELKKFQNFLVYETEAGNLSRQEAVSMIPPLLLDVQSHHYVLDACAAPGSKTAQIVEFLHQSNPGSFPKGLLIANDSDYKRSYLLVHQSLRRLPSPSTMVTNHDASRFPTLSMNGTKLLFDRILCDVPCSGDGTLRKNGGIWRDWTPANGIGLHGLQLRILSRVISLLKPGGRIVYSTCSLNPLENEAVVSAALSQFPSMTLKDVSSCLPNLKRRPGMTSWKVTTRDPHHIESIASHHDLPDSPMTKKYPPTLWPSGRETEHGLQKCLRIYPHLQDTGGFFVAVLEKSLDTSRLPEDLSKSSSTKDAPTAKVDESSEKGVLNQEVPGQIPTPIDSHEHQESCQKAEAQEEIIPAKREIGKANEVNILSGQPDCKRAKLDLPSKMQSNGSPDLCLPSQPATSDIAQSKPGGKPTEKDDPPDNPFKEEPHVYLKAGNEEIKTCIDYYDIDPSFPAHNLLVRNAEGVPTRTIYLTSSVVREVIENNSLERLRLICCGVKLFGRQEPSAGSTTNASGKPVSVTCKWRIVSDGIEYFRPFMGSKRIVHCHINVLKQLITDEQQYPLIENLQDSEFKEQVKKLEIGSCVAEVFDDKDDQNVPLDLMVGLWISKSSVNLMVDKKDRQVLSLRLWGEDLTITTNKSKAPIFCSTSNQLEEANSNTLDPDIKIGEEDHEKMKNIAQSEKSSTTNLIAEENLNTLDSNIKIDQHHPTSQDQTCTEVIGEEIKSIKPDVETKIKDEFT